MNIDRETKIMNIKEKLSAIYLYECVEQASSKHPYICLIIPKDSQNTDFLGLIIHPDSLKFMFLYSLRNQKVIDLYSKEYTQHALEKQNVTDLERLKLTIDKKCPKTEPFEYQLDENIKNIQRVIKPKE